MIFIFVVRIWVKTMQIAIMFNGKQNIYNIVAPLDTVSIARYIKLQWAGGPNLGDQQCFKTLSRSI